MDMGSSPSVMSWCTSFSEEISRPRLGWPPRLAKDASNARAPKPNTGRWFRYNFRKSSKLNRSREEEEEEREEAEAEEEAAAAEEDEEEAAARASKMAWFSYRTSVFIATTCCSVG